MIELLIHFRLILDRLQHPGAGDNLDVVSGHRCSVQFPNWFVDDDMSDAGPTLPGHLAAVPAQHGPQLGHVLTTHLPRARRHAHEQAALARAEGLDGEDLPGLGAGYHPVLVH